MVHEDRVGGLLQLADLLRVEQLRAAGADRRPCGARSPPRRPSSGSRRRASWRSGRPGPRGAGRRPRSRSGSGWRARRTGAAPGAISPAIVAWPSAITSRSADCTLAGARLISSARTKLAKTGPRRVSKLALAVEHLAADHVGRHEVRRELDAAELAAADAGHGLEREGLGEAGDALEQHVAARQQRRPGRGRAGGPGRRRRAGARRGRPPCARGASRPSTGTRVGSGPMGARGLGPSRSCPPRAGGGVRGARRSTIARTRETGTAKPMPTLPEIGPRIDVGMPTRRPAQVEEAAAGVARVDRGVDLDHRDALVVGAADGADDARGDGVLQAERAADGEDLVALAQARRRARRPARRRGRRLPWGLRIARSWRSSSVTIVAGTRRSSEVIRVTVVAPAMTWWLVTTRPDGAEDDAAALAAGVGLHLATTVGADAGDGVGELPSGGRGWRGW